MTTVLNPEQAAAVAAELAAGNVSKVASIEYHGHTFPGYNKPITNKGGGKHKKVVLAKSGDKVKMIGFGHRDYAHNYSAKAKKNYLKRSAGIKNKSGKLTKDDKLSANYWARRVLWPSGPATGAAKKTAHIAGTERALTLLGLTTHKTAAPVWLGPVAKDLGSHALAGAASGAISGGLADEENRLRGAGYGGLAGGVTGLGVGGLSSLVRGLAGALPHQIEALTANSNARQKMYEDALNESKELQKAYHAGVQADNDILDYMSKNLAPSLERQKLIDQHTKDMRDRYTDFRQLLNDDSDTRYDLSRLRAALNNKIKSRNELNEMLPYESLPVALTVGSVMGSASGDNNDR